MWCRSRERGHLVRNRPKARNRAFANARGVLRDFFANPCATTSPRPAAVYRYRAPSPDSTAA